MSDNKMYQVSTLQALALGYTRGVVRAGELLCHGNTGLGTFEDVDGEMIFLDGQIYGANAAGQVRKIPAQTGIPFASVGFLTGASGGELGEIRSMEEMKRFFNRLIDEDFGLNSMYIIRVDGSFRRVSARSEGGFRSHHVELADILQKTGQDFVFENTEGSLVCLYHPDYMDGINAPGWHFHFISADRSRGGHVFDFYMLRGHYTYEKLQRIEIQFPTDKAFDTYALKKVTQADIQKVEQQ